MCGLTGIILGNNPRHVDDYEWLKEAFTETLLRSQARGPHATGFAVIRRDGSYLLLKRPVPATAFVRMEEYEDIMAELDGEVSIIMGHTRYRTIGSELKAHNNHPIRVGRIIGTHNGTIYNASELAKAYNLSRYADVDSEVLFRMANKYRHPRVFNSKLKLLKGQMTAVMVNLNTPNRIRIYKGNKPLSMRMVDDMEAVFYISDPQYFESIDFLGLPLRDYRFKPNRMIQIDAHKPLSLRVSPFSFQPE